MLTNRYGDQLTDHWIVIVARITINSKTKYRFFDPQTSHKSVGTSPNNVLIPDDKSQLKGTYTTAGGSTHEYKLSAVKKQRNDEYEN